MRSRLPVWVALGVTGCAPERDCTETLWWVGEGARVALEADWNDWEAEPMDEAEPGAWRTELALEPGDWAYRFVVDGVDALDPIQPLRATLGDGSEASLLRVLDCTRPVLEDATVLVDAEGGLRVSATFVRGSGGPRLAGAEAHLQKGARGEAVSVPVDLDPATGALSIVARGLPEGKHRLGLVASDRADQRAEITVSFWVGAEPFDWQDALIYQVVLDRFQGDAGDLRPDGYAPEEIGSRMGGTVQGLTSMVRRGYFDALGVNVLWLSPLYDNPDGLWEGSDGERYEGYHGYWSTDPSRVEPELGTEAEVHALVEAAHDRGMRVILDVVPNHVHTEHPWWREHPDWFHPLEVDGEEACICGDYTCPWSSDIETCWFTEYLPDLDWEHPDVAPAMVADTLDWAHRFDLDGFRVDAVPMMPRAAVRELSWAIARELEQGGADFYTLGETFTGPDGWSDIRKNLGPNGLDGQFDFPVMWALRALLVWESGDALDLEAVIAESEARWAGSDSVMAPFVGNHDLSRFLSEAAGQDLSSPWGAPPELPEEDRAFAKLVMAQALVLALPGAPVLYYGDEYGLAGANDPDSRRPMLTDTRLSPLQAQTLAQVQRLGQARRCSEALRRGARVPVFARGGVYAHARVSDEDVALLVLNASDASTRVSLGLPPRVALPMTDVLTGEPIDLSDSTELMLDPWSVRLLLPEASPCG